MNNWKYASYSKDMVGSIVRLLHERCPIKLHKVILLNCPRWFRFVSGMFPKSARQSTRVLHVTNKELQKLVASSMLPTSLGGSHSFSIQEFIIQRIKIENQQH